jgi:dUTPase
MPKSNVTKLELSKLYYVQEKPIAEIAKHFGFSSDDSIRYYINKKEEYKKRDRDYTITDTHAMIQALSDVAEGNDFNSDMALISIATQSRLSKVIEIVQKLWEKKYGKAYPELIEATNYDENDVVSEHLAPTGFKNIIRTNYIKYSDDAVMPQYFTNKGGALSLHSLEQVFLRSGDVKTVRTGIGIEVPNDFVAMIIPDKNLAKSSSISMIASPQIVSCDDFEEIKIKLCNFNKSPTASMIDVGMIIANIIFVQSPFVVWNN